MRRVIIILVLQGVFTPCNTLNAQDFFHSPFVEEVLNGSNRFSVQTGILHQFFDGSPVINPERMHENRTFLKDPLNAWGGRLNDSWGWTFRRSINPKSAIQLEWMKFGATYIGLYTEWEGEPRISGRGRKKYSLTYFYLVPINDKWGWNIGLGSYYQWGPEIYALEPSPPFFYDVYDDLFIGGTRKDLGVNFKSNLEYSPIKQLTLAVGLDWNTSVFLETKSHKGVDIGDFFVEEYSITKFPSRNNISLNFAIGYNF